MAYDKVGNDNANRITVLTTKSGGAETFTYDSANQLLTDHLNGSPTTTYSYDSNGNPLHEINVAGDRPFPFTARSYDCDPNMLFFDSCTRVYGPTPGRWLTEEPIGFEASAGNLASYAGNDSAYECVGLSLACVKAHFICLYDDGAVTFNVEAT